MSGIQHYRRHWHPKFRAVHHLWLDKTHYFRLDSTRRFKLHLTYIFWFDLTQFFNSIWFTFNAFILYLSHIIRVPPQSGFRESDIVQGVFKIIQHWNCGIFHNSENLNWFWWEYSKSFENRRIERKIMTNETPSSSDNPKTESKEEIKGGPVIGNTG